jgi:hypothetical protein
VCRLHLMQLGSEIQRSFITMGRLLKEARDNDYHLEYGYPRFGQWVEESGLDLSERNAYYMINVIERAEQLGIPDDQLQQVKFSSLKEIMALPESTDPEQVKALVTEAKDMSVKDVTAVVGALKNESWVYHNLKILREVEDNVYQPAMERARREYGNTINPDGDPDDISDSRCIEMILANYLAGVEEQEYPIIEGRWSDAITSAEETGASQTTSIRVQGPMPINLNPGWMDM